MQVKPKSLFFNESSGVSKQSSINSIEKIDIISPNKFNRPVQQNQSNSAKIN